MNATQLTQTGAATAIAFKRLACAFGTHGTIWNGTKEAHIDLASSEDVFDMDRTASYLGAMFEGRSDKIRAQAAELISAAADEAEQDSERVSGPMFANNPDFEDHDASAAEAVSLAISNLIDTLTE